MWKSGCCLFVVWLLALIGVAFDVLLSEHGESANGNITADVRYRYGGIRMNVFYENGGNTTRHITYKEAYDDLCVQWNQEDTEWCTELKQVEDSGKAFLATGIIAVVFTFIGAVLAIISTICTKCCRRQCRLEYIVGSFNILTTVCLIIGFGVFWGSYTPNLDDVLDGLFARYFPVAYLVIDWDPAYTGPSIALLIAALGLSVITCGVVCIADSKPRRRRARLANGEEDHYVQARDESEVEQAADTPEGEMVTLA